MFGMPPLLPFLRGLKSPLVSEALEMPFRIVSAGLEGETTFVPRRSALQEDGDESAGVKWRDAIMSSTLPFGAASLPTLVPNCRKELEDR